MNSSKYRRLLLRASVACIVWLTLGSSFLFSQPLPAKFRRINTAAECPAIELDHSIVLMVRGKLRPISGKRELHVDELLFGNDPGPELIFPDLSGTKDPTFSEGIYSLSCKVDGNRLVYNAASQRFHERFLPPAELPAARALAAARMDRLVLGSRAIIIGRPKGAPSLEADSITQAGPLRLKKSTRPTEHMPYAQSHSNYELPEPTPAVESLSQTIVIEKVLYGGMQAGQEIPLQLIEGGTPVPLSGDGPFLYFITANDRGIHLAETVWDASAAPRVLASLATRDEREERHNILFRGSQQETITLLGSAAFQARWLASDRLEHDGPRAKQAIVQAIEEHLLSAEWGVAHPYFQQWRLIRLLGELERNEARPVTEPGELVRLADVLITKATAGETFPQSPKLVPTIPAALQRKSNRYSDFDTSFNHSLAWLLLEMPPDEVAVRYLDRLKNLRDLTSYGWGREAQAIIDRLQLEDRAALSAARRKSASRLSQMFVIEPLMAHAGDLRFAPDNQTLGLRNGHGAKLIWDSNSGKQLAYVPAVNPVARVARAPEPPPKTVVAEDGLQWTFVEESPSGGKWRYRDDPPGAINIFRTPAGEPVKTERRFLRNAKGAKVEEVAATRFFGRVELAHPEPAAPLFGLVPGGQRLYIRTQILDRANLQTISHANVLGQLKLIRFSPSGQHYAICTHHPHSPATPPARPFPQRPQIASEWSAHKFSFTPPEPPTRPTNQAERPAYDALLRVHDTNSGATLLAIDVPQTIVAPKVPEEIMNIAIAPNGSRVAAMTRKGEIFVWAVEFPK